MAKYIDRDKLIMEGWSLQRTYRKDATTMVCEMKKPEDFHATDVRPVVRGKWIRPTRAQNSMLDECSVCGFPTGSFTFNYCPNCGADMRGDAE